MTDTAVTVGSRIGTIAFRLLVPGYFLAVAACAISSASELVQVDRIPANGGPDYSDNWVNLPVNLVISFIFAASVAINGMILLRHPNSLTRREVPTVVAWAQCLLYILILIWIAETIAVFAPSDYRVFDEKMFVVPGVAIAAVSVFIFVCALRRARPYAPRREISRLSTHSVSVAIAFCVVAVALATASLILPPNLGDDDPVLSVSISAANLALGAPWWVLIALTSLIPGLRNAGQVVEHLIEIAPIAINVTLVLVGLASARIRARWTNWFFRLGKEPKNTSSRLKASGLSKPARLD